MSERKHERRTRLIAMGREAYKDHYLASDGVGLHSWTCRRQGESRYRFRIGTLPGCVVVYGDIGELILRPSDSDAIAWLRESVSGEVDYDYLIGKAPECMRRKEFLPGEAEAYLDEMRDTDDDGAIAPRVRETWEDHRDQDDIYTPEQAWQLAWRKETSDPEVPSCSDWEASLFWQVEALRTFVRLLDGKDLV